MVVGNGLVARAFGHLASDNAVLIFASGVSNSNESDPAEYERERSLVRAQQGSKAHFVYFSTCSVHDPSLTESVYVRHKLQMEDWIPKLFENHTILRLPNLVGRTDNPNTLTNHLWNRIKAGEPLRIFAKACRYLMDIDHVVSLTEAILASGKAQNAVLDVVLDNQITVPELVSMLEHIAGRKSAHELVDKGSCYEVISPLTREIASTLSLPNREAYNLALLTKYYGQPTS